MIEIPPIVTLIFPNDTQWAIAAKVPAAVLDAARGELSDFLQGEGSRVVRGNKGMSVLLVFGGSLGEGEDLAEELTRKHKISVFLLEFGDWARIQQFDGARVKRKKGHPADFLESYGVIAPGYEPGPLPVPPITVIGVVEGATLEQACRAMPKKKARFAANSRGVLVDDLVFETLKLSRKLKRRSFMIYYHRDDGTFTCVVREPDQEIEKSFSVGREDANSIPVDSILGETTLEGILRVLDIPRHMLFPDGGAAADEPQSSSSGGTPALEAPPDGREDPG
jgi:hypothetical protein